MLTLTRLLAPVLAGAQSTTVPGAAATLLAASPEQCVLWRELGPSLQGRVTSVTDLSGTAAQEEGIGQRVNEPAEQTSRLPRDPPADI